MHMKADTAIRHTPRIAKPIDVTLQSMETEGHSIMYSIEVGNAECRV